MADQARSSSPRPPKYYKPVLLRTASLCTLLACTLLLIGLTELACQRLPAANSLGFIGEVIRRGLENKNIVASDNRPVEMPRRDNVRVENVLQRQVSVSITSTTMPGTSAPASSDYSQTGTRTTTISSQMYESPPATPAQSNYLLAGTRTSTIEPISSFTVARSDYLLVGTVTITITAETPFATPAPGSYLPIGNIEKGGVIVSVFTMQDYFLGAFLPTIIAVLFTIPWVLLDSIASEAEPFYQLHSPSGAGAADSLCLYYQGMNIFVTPFTALIRGHTVIFYTSLLQLASLALAPFASETVFIALSGTCSANAGGENCPGTLSVFPTAARVIEGLLSGMAILVIGLIFATRRRNSGVFANPNSLAAIATLFHNPKLVALFRNIIPGGKEKELKNDLRALDHIYQLSYYQHPEGTTAYGILMLSASIYSEAQYSGQIAASHQANRRRLPAKPRSNKWKLLLCLLFATCLTGLLVLIIYYLATGGDTPFENFMDSQGFGVRFLFTILGIMIKKFWERTRNYLRNSEPYYQLTLGSVTAENSLLVTLTSNPFSSIISSFQRREFSLPFIDTATILCEPLIVTLANVPFSNGTTFLGFTVCVYISIVILSFMLLALIITFLRMKSMRGEKAPETLAGKMMLLAWSNILERFKVLGNFDEKERDECIRGWGFSYAIGDMLGEDGIVTRAVDFEGFIR